MTLAATDTRTARRGEIVVVARQLIVERGLEGLSIGQLEKRLPYTRGVITHHFANRDDIVDAVLASAVAEIDRATAEEVLRGQPLEAQIHAVLRTKVQGFLQHPEATQILLAFAMRPDGDPRAAEVESRIFDRYRAEASALFHDLGDADALAALLVGTVIGLVVQARVGSSAIDAEACTRAAARAFAQAATRQ